MINGIKDRYESRFRLFYRGLHFALLVVSGIIIRDILEFRKVKTVALGMGKNKNGILGDNQPRVSIIIPTRNEANYLPLLLESIKKQTYPNIEVVVADYLSDDGTRQIASAFGTRFVTVEEKGIGYGSEVGASVSLGDILVRVDADTRLLPDHIEKLVRVFNDRPDVMMVMGGHYYYDGSPLINFIAYIFDKYWRPPFGVSGWMLSIRRTAYTAVGGFDRKMDIGEDYHLARRVYIKYGKGSIFFDRTDLVTLISSRAVLRHGLLSRVKDSKPYSPIR